MRNLKRALSLVLAAMMLIGMMVVSAGAAAKDFTDKAEIKHTEAVEVMTALNVISGKEDGSYFDPNGTLTRAEMAKIISYVMNGGVEPVLGTKVVPTYSDIKGHWAEAYIEYCTSMGIINGDGAGKFNPDGTLTATQCAKMFLTAMGYNANVFGFTGNSWATNTDRYANEAGLYDQLSGLQPSMPISRDNACQMAYNAIQAKMMERSWTQDQATGQITEGYKLGNTTLLATKFGAVVEYAYMTDISYDSVKKEYTYNFNVNGATLGTDNTPAITADGLAQGSLKSAVDYSNLFGQKVKVIYKNSSSEKYPVYGFYSAATIVAEGTMGDISAVTSDGIIAGTATQVKIDGTKYNLDKTAADVDLFNFNNGTAVGTLQTNTVADYQKFVAIDNNGDGKINMIVVYPVTLAKVTYVGTSSITAGGVSYTYNKDESYYENGGYVYEFPTVKKNDYVAITTDVVTNMHRTATVVATVEGKVTALDAANTKVQIDGTWYPYLTATPTINSTYKFQVVNGYLAASEELESASKDLLYVVASDNGSSLKKAQADVMFTDGTRSIIDINKKDGSTTNTSNALTPNALYTYTKNSDGTYDVKAVGASNMAGYDSYNASVSNYVAATSSTNATLGGQLIADDAIIFVKATTASGAEYSVITGATLKTYSSQTTTTAGVALMGTASGLSSIKVATLSVGSVFGVDSTYAYITSAPYTTVEDGVTYYHYTAWTANGSVEVKDAPTSGTPTKGAIVSLINKANGTVSSTALATADGASATVKMPVAITGYNGTDRTITMVKADGTILNTSAMKYGDKVQFLYVNTKDSTGLEGGEIALAEQLPDGSYNMNAYAIYTCNSGSSFAELKAIVFDVNNKLEGVAPAGFTVGAITPTGTASNLSAGDLAYAANVSKAVTGDKVTVTVTASGATTIGGAGVKLTNGSTTTYATIAAGSYTNGQVLATFTIDATSSTTTITEANA